MPSTIITQSVRFVISALSAQFSDRVCDITREELLDTLPWHVTQGIRDCFYVELNDGWQFPNGEQRGSFDSVDETITALNSAQFC